jgi:hypothetical protein
MVCKSHSVIFSDETMDLFKAALINNELYFAVELANKFIDDSDITDDFQVYFETNVWGEEQITYAMISGAVTKITKSAALITFYQEMSELVFFDAVEFVSETSLIANFNIYQNMILKFFSSLEELEFCQFAIGLSGLTAEDLEASPIKDTLEALNFGNAKAAVDTAIGEANFVTLDLGGKCDLVFTYFFSFLNFIDFLNNQKKSNFKDCIIQLVFCNL